MSKPPDVRVLEMMASKICHDLISPVGAIANGVEFLEDMGADAGEEVTGLISYSAAQASAKLKALRLVYGAGGADSSIKPKEVHDIFEDFIMGENRIRQNWNLQDPIGLREPTTGFAKMLMACLLLTCEALPKGGTITVGEDGDHITLIKGEGENAGFRDGYLNALRHKITPADLEPKFVHAYMTGLLADSYSYTIEVDESQNNIILLRLKIPHVS